MIKKLLPPPLVFGDGSVFLQTFLLKQKQCLSDRKTYGILSIRVLSINGKRYPPDWV